MCRECNFVWFRDQAQKMSWCRTGRLRNRVIFTFFSHHHTRELFESDTNWASELKRMHRFFCIGNSISRIAKCSREFPKKCYHLQLELQNPISHQRNYISKIWSTFCYMRVLRAIQWNLSEITLILVRSERAGLARKGVFANIVISLNFGTLFFGAGERYKNFGLQFFVVPPWDHIGRVLEKLGSFWAGAGEQGLHKGLIFRESTFFWAINVSRSYLVGYFVYGVTVNGATLTNLKTATRYILEIWKITVSENVSQIFKKKRCLVGMYNRISAAASVALNIVIVRFLVLWTAYSIRVRAYVRSICF